MNYGGRFMRLYRRQGSRPSPRERNAKRQNDYLRRITLQIADKKKREAKGKGDCSHEIKRCLTPWKKSYDKPRQHIKKQGHYFVDKDPSSQSYGFSSHVWMWELDYKEGWAPKNWCFWIVMLEKTLESPLDCKEMQPVHFKGNQSWIFLGRTDAEAETTILLPPDTKNWLIWKDPDAGQDWRQEEKGITEDEMLGWHHWLDGYEFEQAPGVDDGQGRLVCCSPWGHKESDTTERLNWTEKWKSGFLLRLETSQGYLL